MPLPNPEPITLTPKQRIILRQLARQGTCPQRLAQRARILLAADSGTPNEQIAQQLAVDRNTVIRWRKRWALAAEKLVSIEASEHDKGIQQQITAVLDDDPRPGTPPTFRAEQICQMIALACEDPLKSGRPISHWTPRELADELVGRNIVAQISPRHVGRFLKGIRDQTSPVPLLAQRRPG